MPEERQGLARAFTYGVTWRFGGRFSDLCYGYIAFWRSALKHLSLEKDDGFEIETSMNVQALTQGLVVHEVPSIEAPRIHGVSNLRTIPDGWRVLMKIFQLSFAHPFSRPQRHLYRDRLNHRNAVVKNVSDSTV